MAEKKMSNMNTYEVKTKVYKAETGEFIGNSTATVEADDKAEARFFFRHHCIEMNTPKDLKIVGDLRTLKLEQN
jgi:hypothetical protein